MTGKFFSRRSKAASTWDSVVFDVETTGLFPGGHDRVVEIAALRLSRDGEVIDRFDTLINPVRDIGATHIHGVTASDVQDAPPFESIVGDIASFMAAAALVAHNASFDTRFAGSRSRGRMSADTSAQQHCGPCYSSTSSSIRCRKSSSRLWLP